MLQLVLFWQTKKPCNLLAALDKILHPVIKDCRETITSFCDEIALKYDKSLGETAGSRLSLGRAGKMLQWHCFRSEKATSLRDKIFKSMATISLIQGLAHWYISL
jgi:hypothetical protein